MVVGGCFYQGPGDSTSFVVNGGSLTSGVLPSARYVGETEYDMGLD